MKNNIISILKFFAVSVILICTVITILLILNVAPSQELNKALQDGLLIISTLVITSVFIIFILKINK